MTDYKNIHGKRVKFFTSDLDNTQAEGQIFYSGIDATASAVGAFNFKTAVAISAWSSASPFLTGRTTAGGAGTQTAHIGFSGYLSTNTPTNVTEEYNGSGWSNGGNMNNGRKDPAGAGTQTATLAFGGDERPPGSNNVALTEEYNGTSWSPQNNMNTGRTSVGSAGTQTAGLGFGGPGSSTATEEYDGTSWTNSGALNSGRNGIIGIGTQTAAVGAGGYTPGYLANVEHYNGSTWTAATALPSAQGTGGGAGIQTDGLIFGGYVPPGHTVTNRTLNYNGTSWTVSPATLGTARGLSANTSSAPSSAAIAMMGETTPTNTLTEEFNTIASTVTGAAWASGGNMPTTKLNGGQGIGTELAAAVFGGNQTTITYPYVNTTYEYDGSSWGSGGNMNNTGSSHGAFGTQTAGTKIGSYMYPPNVSTTNVEEYDGSSWTAKPAMSQTRYGAGGAGISTAGLAMGGTAKSPVVALTAVEEYDGEGWTSGGALPAHHENFASGGTQTAAIVAGGQDPAPQSNGASVTSYDYNGSSWTSNPNMSIDKVYNFGNGGPVSQTSFLSATGNTGPGTASNNCELFDGTSWATAASVSTARSQHMNAQHGTTGTNGALIAGGRPPPTGVNTSEVFTAETTAVNLKTITDS